jgi:uncharacterized protein (TIGR03435 family)
MLQSLLEDRFKLIFHSATKELPLYELVTLARDGEDRPPSARTAFQLYRRPAPMLMMSKGGPLRIAANVQSMTDPANMLSNQIGTPVVDKTGLTGTYDFALEFVPERVGAGGIGGGLVAPGEVPGASPNTFDGPTIFGAVQDQLGLKLEQKKGPLEVMVIDRAERVPSEN